MKYLSLLLMLILSLTVYCTLPKALKSIKLNGLDSDYAVRVSTIIPDTLDNSSKNDLEKILVSETDSSYIFTWCEENDNIIVATIYYFNGCNNSVPFYINNAVLKDGLSIMQRQIYPHEAANIFASYVTPIPQYVPKYSYEVNSKTTGHLNMYDYGDGYYSGNYYGETESEIEAKEDPYNQLGWALGAAITAEQNKKILDKAAYLYSTGIVDCIIPANTALFGSLFWLNNIRSYPIQLEIMVDNTHFVFDFDLGN